jgi:ATP-dependent DNA helicase DinG
VSGLVDRVNPLLASLPEKFEKIYDWQIDAVVEIMEGFEAGEKVVVLEAPTGTGKTLIAEVVRRLLEVKGVYVCHNKELQDQFCRDFPYARTVYGRANYEPPKGVGVTCEDCTWKQEVGCRWCDSLRACPYNRAKTAAIGADVAVLNSAYWLNETQAEKSVFGGAGLVVMDEADTLEGVLMGQVEVYVGERAQKAYRIGPPKMMTKGFVEWGERTLMVLEDRIGELNGSDYLDVAGSRELKRVIRLAGGVGQLLADVRGGIPWVYTGGAGSKRRRGDTISFKPVTVDKYGDMRVWQNGERFLVMAALVPEVTIQGLGWTEGYKRVRVESQFPVANRQVVVRPVATVTRKAFDDDGARRLASAVGAVLREHRGERVLVHSVSYALRDTVYGGLQGMGRRLISYKSSAERGRAIQEFKTTPASVLLAPGLERGIDLPDNLCRAQVIVKVPFPNLGDKQVAERLYNSANGKVWYNQQVATSLLQMVGRGVRHREDWCVTYVLDGSFLGWYRQWGHLLPMWFRKGIRVER